MFPLAGLEMIESMRTLRTIVAATAISAFQAFAAQAATLNVVGGKLVGASNVDVNGSFYDVSFVDGTCAALFSGCNEISDFTFQSYASALSAAAALLNLVFIDGVQGNFDSNPSLTAGCTNLISCAVFTPYSPAFTQSVFVSYADNAEDLLFADHVSSGDIFRTDDTTPSAHSVFAVWTPVPEPTPPVLLGLGLSLLAARIRSIKQLAFCKGG